MTDQDTTTDKGAADETAAPAKLTDEQIEKHNTLAGKKLVLFARTINQGEWLKITRLLNVTREEVGEDQALGFIVCAWVKERRGKGGDDLLILDHILDWTDRELQEYHGVIHSDDDANPVDGDD